MAPQHTGTPPASSAHEWYAPACTLSTPTAAAAGGSEAAPDPQHHTLPDTTAHVCAAPTASDVTALAAVTSTPTGTVVEPLAVEPQHVTPSRPGAWMTHACAAPTASVSTEPTTCRASGTSRCPCALAPPQQYTTPACDSAQLKSAPEPSVRMPHRAASGSAVCPVSLRPQHRTRPQSSVAHANPSPTDTLEPIVTAHAMPSGSGAPELVGVALREDVTVPVPALLGVPEGVRGLLGRADDDGSREDVTVGAGVPAGVADVVRAGVGELEGVADGVRDANATTKPGLNGGITTPR